VRRAIALILLISILLTACSGGNNAPTGGKDTNLEADTKKMTQINMLYGTELSTLNYLSTSVTDNQQLAYLTVDPLIEFDQYGVMMPSTAIEWSKSDDGLVYTFKLREGMHWYTHEGEEYGEVVADDFVTGIKWVLTQENGSKVANSVYNVIKNGEEYYNGEIDNFEQVGVKATDKYILEYTLKEPTPYFLRGTHNMCFYPVSAEFLNELEERGEEFGTSNDTLLYDGAYIMTKFEPEDRRILEYNENYWNKDIISVEKITYKYNKEASAIGHELFLRGEINDISIPGSILDEWMNDPEKRNLMYPKPLTNMTYWMGFNFEPNYEDEYKPEDWKTAVNNKNFRKSLFHGLDRLAAVSVLSPYDAERKLVNTVTRRDLVQSNGVDYTMLGGLKKFTETDSFDETKALEYKEKAIEELTGKVDFPIKVIFTYTVESAEGANRAQVIEQQMEKLLGDDYIDIVLVGYPNTGYTNAVREPGKFSMMIIGWGPDFIDPMGSFDFLLESVRGSSTTRIHLAEEYIEANGNGKFENMIIEANKEVLDNDKRYEMFADAETFLLDEALVVPFFMSGGGFSASYLDPFTRYKSQSGLSGLGKLKGVVVLDEPMGMDRFEEEEKTFLKKVEEARKNAKYE
jgi:oligopeptide transport system substrate-binding protein